MPPCQPQRGESAHPDERPVLDSLESLEEVLVVELVEKLQVGAAHLHRVGHHVLHEGFLFATPLSLCWSLLLDASYKKEPRI